MVHPLLNLETWNFGPAWVQTSLYLLLCLLSPKVQWWKNIQRWNEPGNGNNKEESGRRLAWGPRHNNITLGRGEKKSSLQELQIKSRKEDSRFHIEIWDELKLGWYWARSWDRIQYLKIKNFRHGEIWNFYLKLGQNQRNIAGICIRILTLVKNYWFIWPNSYKIRIWF